MNQTLNKQKNISSTNDQDEFYHDLDQKKSHQSCCTCQTLMIFFIVLLIISSGGIFYFYWQITHGGFIFGGTHSQSKLADITQKLDNPSPVGQDLRLVLSADDLNTMLGGGLSIENLILKDVVLSINTQEILIYGTLVQPLKSKVLISCLPVPDNGKIKLNVTKITAGKVTLPNMFNEKISNSLTSLLDQKLESIYKKYTINQVILEQNQLVINGKLK